MDELVVLIRYGGFSFSLAHGFVVSSLYLGTEQIGVKWRGGIYP